MHSVAYLVGPPADEHGAGGRRDLRELVRRHEVEDPVHRIAGTGDEAVKRHRPVHDHLAISGARIAHALPPKADAVIRSGARLAAILVVLIVSSSGVVRPLA